MTNTLIILTNYRNYLKKLFPQSLSFIINGELFLKMPVLKIHKIMFFLKKHTQSQYKILSDICAIDYPWKKNRFEIMYNLLSIFYNTRISIFSLINEKDVVQSISNIFKIANWFEREIWDMFGIHFKNNPDLRRILTDYGFKGHPLRKDFPLTGYIEVSYYNIEKRIQSNEISLSQDLRVFYFKNTWNNN